MMNLRPVSMETSHEIEQLLYTEAFMLDREMLREWLDTVVDPRIRYQMIVTDERFRRDKAVAADREVLLFDDDHMALDMRVRQFETGLQTMNNPAQRLFRVITNVQAFHREADGEFMVRSYGTLSRFRRLYENEQAVFGREDVWSRDSDGALRLVTRRIDLGERVIRNKNLLVFL